MIDADTVLARGYEVLEHLSRGRHLDVFEVWSEERACRCVIKALRPDVRGDLAAERRLRNEGRLLARLTHPHVVRAYETIEGPHGVVVVLETLGGETLSHLIARRKTRMPPPSSPGSVCTCAPPCTTCTTRASCTSTSSRPTSSTSRAWPRSST